jgi:hypothetical protein
MPEECETSRYTRNEPWPELRTFSSRAHNGLDMPRRPTARTLGDGLVPLDSALGRHANPRQALAFAEDRQFIVYGTHHLDLLSSTEVYEQLRRWLV